MCSPRRFITSQHRCITSLSRSITSPNRCTTSRLTISRRPSITPRPWSPTCVGPSTTIIAKALANLGKSKERFSEIIFGILIVEDILAIVMIALLSGMAMTGSLETSGVIMTMGRLGVFLVVAVVLGLLAVPRLLGYVARFQSNEMLLITVLGLCFGVSLLAVKLNYNVALGAFIIGAVIAEARQIARIEVLMAPIRDMFSAVFFVTIGLQIDPRLLAQHAVPAFVITAAVVIGKVVSCAFGTFVAGHTTRTSLRVGMGLAQIGEFSFIIASLGLTLKVTSDFLYPIAVTVSLITTLLTPYLIQSADGLVAWFDRVAPPTFVKYLQLYTGWVSQLGGRRKDNLGGRLIRKWAWQMGLNLTLIAGVFLAAAFLAQGSPRWLPRVYESAESMKALLWLCAMLLSLPLLIATFRKLQALGILLSEMSVNFDAAGARVASYRAIVSHAIPVAGLMGMGLLILLLSSTLLPPLKVLILLGLVVVLIAFLLWRSLIKLYSKAQIALHDDGEAIAHHARRASSSVRGFTVVSVSTRWLVSTTLPPRARWCVSKPFTTSVPSTSSASKGSSSTHTEGAASSARRASATLRRCPCDRVRIGERWRLRMPRRCNAPCTASGR